MQLFYQPGIPRGVHYLDPEESRHCIKVLRKHLHDTIDLVDGQGTFYKAQITDTNPKQTGFSIVEQESEADPGYHIHLALAPTKRLERMEWLVEKATELGVGRISFLQCQNSQRFKLRVHRLVRKAVSAMKQSERATLPAIDETLPFTEFLQQVPETTGKYIAHLHPQAVSLQAAVRQGDRYCVLIGPEGDFTAQELSEARQEGFQPVHLGTKRLRTETAALAVVVTLYLIN